MSAELAHVVALKLPERSARGLILHVDDDDAMRRSTGMLLRSAGFETREASNGEQAIAQSESLRGRLDVLIVDYHLGYSMTGTEVAEVTFQLPFSREQESEADQIGLELMARAGYDPHAAIALWKKMSAAESSEQPKFLSTHPAPKDRIKDIEKNLPRVMPLYAKRG